MFIIIIVIITKLFTQDLAFSLPHYLWLALNCVSTSAYVVALACKSRCSDSVRHPAKTTCCGIRWCVSCRMQHDTSSSSSSSSS